MAPRKAKAAEEDDRLTELKLIMEQGPLSGQTFGFSPRCVVRIGRTARGNTLAVMDAGVSTKHLLIQVETKAVSGDRCWTITDLGSSNGTILNDESLESSVVLSHGDIIKIGEETSIRVEFGGNVVENKVSSRRNAGRGVRGKARDLRPIDEFSELGLGDEEDEIKIDVVAGVEVMQEGNVSTRRTRSSRNNLKDLKADESKDLGLNAVRKLQELNTRRTRGSAKEGDAVETAMDLSLIEGRKTIGRKKKHVESITEETEKVVEDMNTAREDEAAGLETTSRVRESDVNTGKEKISVDLEAMSMGEWFDFLEVYLPQQIIEETEDKIVEMRQTAERFHNYVVQQKKSKAMSEVTKV